MPVCRSLRPHQWLLVLTACSGGLLTVHIEQTSTSNVPGSDLPVLFDVLPLDFQDLDVSVDSELANQGVADGDIVEVRLTQLTISTPDADDLAFITSLDVFVASPDVEKVRIAHYGAFPEGVPSVDMELDDVDLHDYVVAESMTITTEASGDVPPEDTTVDAFIGLDVQATAQGACNAAKRR